MQVAQLCDLCNTANLLLGHAVLLRRKLEEAVQYGNMPLWFEDKENSRDILPSSSTWKMVAHLNSQHGTHKVLIYSFAPAARHASASKQLAGTQQPCIISVHDQMYRTMKRPTLKRHKTGAKKQMLEYVSDGLPSRR